MMEQGEDNEVGKHAPCIECGGYTVYNGALLQCTRCGHRQEPGETNGLFDHTYTDTDDTDDMYDDYD